MLDWEAKCVSGNRKEGDLMQFIKTALMLFANILAAYI